MKSLLVLLLMLATLWSNGQEVKDIKFFQTDWGRTISWDAFCKNVKAAGYDGIEIWLPEKKEEQDQLKQALDRHNLEVGFLNGTNKKLPFTQSLEVYKKHLEELVNWSPAYINCHTGSDFFTFEQNKAFIDIATEISKKTGIPIYHETHRGRFSYNLPDTRTYLDKIPELQLNLDISHWMVVHESLLENQDTELLPVLQRTQHIHARIGFAQGPQVNDPEAPEWKKAVERHVDIWEQIIRTSWKTKDVFTITTEFGPPNYMPSMPYTKMPLADQWKANLYMMKIIKKQLNID